jgi:hypothetical protein
LPSPLKFILIGALCGVLLSLKFATHGELSGVPSPSWGFSLLAYFGVYCGVLCTWLLMRAVWAFSYHNVFWVGGLAFAMVEENRVVLRTLLGGDLLGGSMLLAYLIPMFGLPFASVFLLMPDDELPRAGRRPGLAALVAFATLPLLLHAYWGVAWQTMLRAACGSSPGSPG